MSTATTENGDREIETTPEQQGLCPKVLDTKEAKKQVMFSIPMILTGVSYYSVPLVSLMVAGHLGKLELAGSALANSWALVTGFALLIGLSGALETLCGQGYGADLYRMLGIYMQSSMIISVFFSVIISFIWFYSEPILILLHQQPQVAKLAAVYIRYMIPGIFAYAILQCILRFMQTQTVVMPLLVCSAVPLVIHIPLTYILVHRTVLGFRGAALAAAISQWISLFMLWFYLSYSDKFEYTWQGFSTECFKYVLPTLKLAIPSAVMVCLEYWVMEILVLLAGQMHNSEINTSVIAMCVNTEAAVYMFTYGFSATVSTRVSNELGAGNVERAKNAITVILKLSILVVFVVISLLLFGHNIWASTFSDNSVIKKDFASLAPFLAISILFDTIQGVLSGVARGCGWQLLAAFTNLISLYMIGLPTSVLLGFKLQLHAKGLWIGLICGLFCQACIMLTITLRTNWSKLELVTENDREEMVVIGIGL
ncbi:hypothetical protein ACHQM5_016083 [Ranunculus cassubicifolius]